MKRAKVFRGLRIAVSAVFGILCVLSVVLWVRSYYFNDVVALRGGPSNVFVESVMGRIVFGRDPNPHSFSQEIDGWESLWQAVRTGENNFGFKVIDDRLCNHFSIQMPHWWLLLVTSSTTAVLAIGRPYRFGLRTLLIATTLIAVVLGAWACLRLW